MSAAQQHAYRAPFDAIADRYDQSFTYSWIGQAQRAPVWSELAKVFHAGQHVLEIGCGTGIDAAFLAKREVRVTACDSSPEMISITTRRIQENRLQPLVKPLVLRAEEIGKLRPMRCVRWSLFEFWRAELRRRSFQPFDRSCGSSPSRGQM